jgi:hypothetical protein
MTEFLHQDRLRLIARITEHPAEMPPGPTTSPRWTIDATGSRPIAHWVLREPAVDEAKRDLPSA